MSDGLTTSAAQRELLAAVVDALDIPHPATSADVAEWHRVRSARADHVLYAVQTVLAERGAPPGDVLIAADSLRRFAAAQPVDRYLHAPPVHGGERSLDDVSGQRRLFGDPGPAGRAQPGGGWISGPGNK